MLGLRFCARAFPSCGKRGPLFIAVRGPLTIAASLVAEHRLQTRRLSNCGSRAQLLRSTWYLPRPGLEPVSPALAGRFSTTAPPGKPQSNLLKIQMDHILSALKNMQWLTPTFRIKSKLLTRSYKTLHDLSPTHSGFISHHSPQKPVAVSLTQQDFSLLGASVPAFPWPGMLCPQTFK